MVLDAEVIESLECSTQSLQYTFSVLRVKHILEHFHPQNQKTIKHNRETIVGQKRVQHLLTSRTAVGRNVDGLVSGHGSDLEMKGYIVEKHGTETYCLKFCAPMQF